MSIRRPIVIANWKLNGDPALCSEFAVGFAGWALSSVDVVICPPAVYLEGMSKALNDSGEEPLALAGVQLGAQNVAAEGSGAFTGEISATMLRSVGCTYCIVGHSERRASFGDTDELIALKIKQLLESKLIVVLCVGESLDQREAGEAEGVVNKQLETALEGLDREALESIIIAYEPIWAIGTGKTATPQQAEAMHASIRSFMASQCQEAAKSMRIVYGGSVKSSNAAGLFEQRNIDGALVGGASLVLDNFMAICHTAGELAC